ncbi:hypothetical protein PQX77_014109 [Marasmius sp. AFHP31]|nr:hypothetical protein PQX77_014109 [Marasmius sp. AFHP31]
MYSTLFLVTLAVFTAFVLRRRRLGPLPPGPRGLPLLGNFRDIATSRDVSWIRYWKWSQVYGDIVHLKVFGHHTVVLNSAKVIEDLLEKRSKNYSDRPDMPMFMDLMGSTWNFAVFRYSDWWRMHRRTFHQRFQQRAVPEYYDIQRSAASSFIDNLTRSPENFLSHIQHFTGSIVLKIAYGYTLQTNDDPYIRLVLDMLEGVKAAAIHGSFWVDYLPILKYVPAWLPGAGFKKKAEEWRQSTREVRDRPWGWVKAAVEDGTANPSFCTLSADRLSVTLGDGSMTEEVIKNCAAMAYNGSSLLSGTDTVASSIVSFILAMVLHPEYQERAQKEIDAVVGTGRLPDFDDREKMPFVNALIAETLRWNPATPTGVDHRALNDDMYEGYFIPAGATIVPNVWVVLHDETLYGPRTQDFDPDRFLKQELGKEIPPSPEIWAFGFGRRICPGRYLAVNNLYLAMSYILASFTIKKPIDDAGVEITPEVDYMDGIISLAGPSPTIREDNRSLVLVEAPNLKLEAQKRRYEDLKHVGKIWDSS